MTDETRSLMSAAGYSLLTGLAVSGAALPEANPDPAVKKISKKKLQRRKKNKQQRQARKRNRRK